MSKYSIPRHLFVVCTLFVAGLASSAQAAFIRLGPFDIDPTLSFEAVYSSNIDGVRESEAEEDMEDFYLVYGAGANMAADFTEEWHLESDFGVSLERHMIRDDLNSDNVDDLFGNFGFQNTIESGYYNLTLEAEFERTTEVDDDEFVSGSLQTRDPHNSVFLLGELAWKRKQYEMTVGYSYEQERHDEEVFKDADSDEEEFYFGGKWHTHERFATVYTYSREKTHLLNVTNDPANDLWEETQFAGFEIAILNQNPDLNYTIGMETEDSYGTPGDWELIHAFDASWLIEFSRNTTLELGADYSIEDQPEADDIEFTYSAVLDNEFSSDINNKIEWTRKPVDTFNSTADTDSTDLTYKFEKRNLLLNDIDFLFDITWSRDEPLATDELTEKEVSYGFHLKHQLELTRKISQTLAYDYTVEDVDTEDEEIAEHRVSLLYNWDF